jgi:hypothetical protein
VQQQQQQYPPPFGYYAAPPDANAYYRMGPPLPPLRRSSNIPETTDSSTNSAAPAEAPIPAEAPPPPAAPAATPTASTESSGFSGVTLKQRDSPEEQSKKWSPRTISDDVLKAKESKWSPLTPPPKTPPPLTTRDEIHYIVTKRLWSDNVTDVAEAMSSLATLVVDAATEEAAAASDDDDDDASVVSNNSNKSTSNAATTSGQKSSKDSNMRRQQQWLLATVLRGAPIVIAQAMRRFSSSRDVQWHACRTLANMCNGTLVSTTTNAFSSNTTGSGQTTIQEDIVEAGCLYACLDAMQAQQDDVHVQIAGCNLIGNLWRCALVRRTIVKEGGLATVVNAIKNQKHETNVMVQAFAVHALLTLLLHEDRGSGATDAVDHELPVNDDDEEKKACAKAVVDAGAIPAVILAMENHGTMAKLQQDACQLLGILARTKTTKTSSTSASSSTSSRYGDDDEYQYRNAIIEAKGLVAIVEARRIHKDDAKVVEQARNAARAIDNFF